jgi:hypothetical protein
VRAADVTLAVSSRGDFEFDFHVTFNEMARPWVGREVNWDVLGSFDFCCFSGCLCTGVHDEGTIGRR